MRCPTKLEFIVILLTLGLISIIGALIIKEPIFKREVQDPEKARSNAIQALKNFSNNAGLSAIDCTSKTTSNGYVECTAKDKSGKFITLECGFNNREQGCRLQKIW